MFKSVDVLHEAGLNETYYCLEVVSLAGLFIIKGAAPPPSRKLTAEPWPLSLVDLSAPSKYFAKLTDDPLNVALGFRIPGTALWLGWV